MMDLQYRRVTVFLVCLYTGAQGCQRGFYGFDCSRPCPATCKTDHCTRSGLCDVCTPGLYGIRCNHRCPSTCIHSDCNRYNVTCTRGCKQGWYGKKCEKQCTDCAEGCHRYTGKCSSENSPKALPLKSSATEVRNSPHRCDQDSKFKDRCIAGCWGGNCDTHCPDICLQCDSNGENCTSCVAGKYGERCDKTCPGPCPRTCDMYGDCVNTYHALALEYDVSNNSGSTTPTMTVIAVLCGGRSWLW